MRCQLNQKWEWGENEGKSEPRGTSSFHFYVSKAPACVDGFPPGFQASLTWYGIWWHLISASKEMRKISFFKQMFITAQINENKKQNMCSLLDLRRDDESNFFSLDLNLSNSVAKRDSVGCDEWRHKSCFGSVMFSLLLRWRLGPRRCLVISLKHNTNGLSCSFCIIRPKLCCCCRGALH